MVNEQIGSSVAGDRLLSNKDGVLRIGIEGRVDSNTAPEIETDINEILAANKFDALILDFSDLVILCIFPVLEFVSY